MNYIETINEIFQVCIIPLLGVLTMFLVNYVKAKSEEIKVGKDSELSKKYIDMLTQTITDCVIATNQTYVNSLKNKNAFDADAQREAFKLTQEAVLTILSDDAKEYLDNMYGDLNVYIVKQIEATVNLNKQ